MTSAPLRLCLLYDCLFPYTIGGAERWYRNLAERLVAAGRDVTFVTLRQWEIGEEPDIPGVRVVAVGPRMPLYKDGKRRIWPPLRYGLGVFWHLLRHPRRYDWLHMASFPYFSLVAAGLLRPMSSYRIAVDWHEVWSRDYWREYLGPLGWVGWQVQRFCAKVPQVAYAFSKLHGARAKAAGVRGAVTLLTGEYAGGEHQSLTSAAEPSTIVYAGRFIPEKRVPLLVEALAVLMREDRDLRAVLYGQGPELERVRDRVAELGLTDRVQLPGFVGADELEAGMCGAAAIVQPSAREGYGMVVVEASARGVPVVVVQGEDNAAIELVAAGRNGFIADAEPEALAEAIRACMRGAEALRTATREWYAENERKLSLSHSLEVVVANYGLASR
jgi:glycosyltransferase involved in cell wall biosynthesis